MTVFTSSIGPHLLQPLRTLLDAPTGDRALRRQGGIQLARGPQPAVGI